MTTVKLTAAIFAILLFVSCNSKQGTNTTKTTETTTTIAPAAPEAPDWAKIKTEIQAIETDYAKGQNNKDVETILALFSDDAVSMPAGKPALIGKTAIKVALVKDFSQQTDGDVWSFETQDVFGSKEFVTEFGKTTISDASGKVRRTGKYSAMFQKIDGKYRCIREIYNMDN